MNASTPEQPKPTEKAQIVVLYSYGSTNVFRFNTTNKGEKEYKALYAAWKKLTPEKQLHEVKADMFDGVVDLYQIVSVCYVDHAKRNKFIPIP